MERRSKQQKYVQMIIPNSQNPISLKFNKDNVLEISLLPPSKYSGCLQKQIWIPPPAKTSRRLPGSQKCPNNNVIINIPAHGTIETADYQTFRIDPGKKQDKMTQERRVNISLKEDNKIPEFQKQTQRMKGNLDAQEQVLDEAEKLLKEHENRQKIMSTYSRALKKNMQDLNKSIHELENQDNVSSKMISKQTVNLHYNDNDEEKQTILSLKQKDVYEDKETEDISQGYFPRGNQSLNKEKISRRKLNGSGKASRKWELKRTCSMENVSMMYLPIDRSIQKDSEEESDTAATNKDKTREKMTSTSEDSEEEINRTATNKGKAHKQMVSTREDSVEESNRAATNKVKTRKQMTSQQCIPTEKLMMKLSDNMRKTKFLLDSVHQEDEVVDLMQKKYVSEVVKLYREQQELLEKLNQVLEKTSSDATSPSLESFQVHNAKNQFNNAGKKSLKHGQIREVNSGERLSPCFKDVQLRKETNSLEDQLEQAEVKLIKLKDELQDAKASQLKSKPAIKLTKQLSVHNSGINQSKPEGTTIGKETVVSTFKKDGLKDTIKKSRFNDSSKSDNYSCNTEIQQVVRHLPSNISGKFKISNNSKADDAFGNDSYISETKITQKLRFLPLNSKERNMTKYNTHPIKDILNDISRSIDKVMPFRSNTLPESEYLNTEEGSLTIDDTSYKESPQKPYNERDTSKTRGTRTQISESSDYNGRQKNQTQVEYQRKFDFDPERYSLTNDNTKPKDISHNSYDKNGTLKKQDELRKVPERSANDETRQKYQTQKEYNHRKENGRGIIDSDRKPTQSNSSSQTFHALSEVEECDCSGECTKLNHFDPDEYSLRSDNNGHKDVSHKSSSKNGTLKKQGEATKVSESSDYDKTRQKEYKQNGENGRGIRDSNRKSTQSNQYESTAHGYGSSEKFTALSEMEECDCSGECTELNHFDPEEYSLRSDNTGYEDVSHKSDNKNGTVKKQATKVSERFDNDKTRQKEYNQQRENGRGIRDSNEKYTQSNQHESTAHGYGSSQTFNALSEMEECDCSGECTELNHFDPEEYSLRSDNNGHKDVSHKSYNKNGTLKKQEEATKVSEHAGNDKTRQKDYNQHREIGRGIRDSNRRSKQSNQYENTAHGNGSSEKFTALSEMEECKCSGECIKLNHSDPEEYSLRDNTGYKYVQHKSFNKNGTLKKQDEATEVSERSGNDKTRQKENNQHREGGRGIRDSNRRSTQSNEYGGTTRNGSSQTITALSEIEECDCSGECTNLNHFIESLSLQNPNKVKDKSHQKNKFSFSSNATPLAESTRIDSDSFNSKNDYNNKNYDPSKEKNKAKKENRYFPKQTPLAESTRIDDSTSNSQSNDKCRKSDPSREENKSRPDSIFKFYRNQTQDEESPRMNFENKNETDFKSQKNQPVHNFTPNESNNPHNYQSDSHFRKHRIATDVDDKRFDSRIADKNLERAKKISNDAIDIPICSRNMQATMNEFLYENPTMPKEKISDPILASSPRKIIKCENKCAKSIPLTTANDDTSISNMQKASNKINALYKDIMSQF